MSQSLFTAHHYTIYFDNFNEPIYLLPFGDIHRFAKLCDVQRWKEFLTWCQKKDKESRGRCYYLGMGDYDDFGSDSERAAFRSAKLHDDTEESIDDINDRRVRIMEEELKFMKGKTVGMMEGNHRWLFPSGMTNCQLLCKALDARYLGGASMIRLTFVQRSRPGCRMKLDIFAAHGHGGGRTHGADVSSVERMAQTGEADIYLSGHTHRKFAVLLNRIRLTSAKDGVHCRTRKILLCRTGTFLEAYRDGQRSYVVPMTLPPTDRGVVKIELTPKRETHKEGNRQVEETYIDIHASI